MKKETRFKIEGFVNGDSRKVFVNGIELEIQPEYFSNGFNWGYHGQASTALAAAILLKFIPVKKSIKEIPNFHNMVLKFRDQHVVGWGYGNFMVEIDFEHWFDFHARYKGEIMFHHRISSAKK